MLKNLPQNSNFIYSVFIHETIHFLKYYVFGKWIHLWDECWSSTWADARKIHKKICSRLRNVWWMNAGAALCGQFSTLWVNAHIQIWIWIFITILFCVYRRKYKINTDSFNLNTEYLDTMFENEHIKYRQTLFSIEHFVIWIFRAHSPHATCHLIESVRFQKMNTYVTTMYITDWYNW